ncbi:hypothetical protein [Oceanirhabdus sp. W0125-5]|uniref:hypothetical protein n=1 Tax=Oceanirhabdus sp. W0125-5 TaxID=2999116 RepID=UPI0022F33EC8|nr:hypothetical protein [Oceanirhabdus sp. W0125-5]WBW97757.1 hypothetical protein OW730_02960 [Oceanirhabdus sp. W0125-5]
MKKILTLGLCLVLFFTCGISVQAANISEKDDLLEIMSLTKDKKVREKYLEIKKYGKLIQSKEAYIEIIEDITQPNSVELKNYSPSEYFNMRSLDLLTSSVQVEQEVSSWMKLRINIYDMSFRNEDEISVTCSFEWLETPYIQIPDYFGVGVSSTLTLPGERDLDEVMFTYFPDKNNYNISKTYHGDTERDTFILQEINGIGVNFPFAPSSIQPEMYSAGIYTIGSQYYPSKLLTAPKGILTFGGWRTNTIDNYATLLVSYGHNSVGLAINPTMSVDSNGNISYPSFGIGSKIDDKFIRIRYEFEK